MRHAAALALIALTVAAPSAQRAAADTPTPPEALARARAYLAAWQDTLASLVVDEVYTQEVRVYRARWSRYELLGPRTRELRSELLLLRAPAENVWLSFRDVIAVDGKTVTDRQKRFDALFSGPAAAIVSTAEQIALEGARYNLGRLNRTINTPTAALVFLHPRYEANTTWRLESSGRFDGAAAWELGFDQRTPPFAVTAHGVPHQRSSGRFWLEPGTGRILGWELQARAGSSVLRVSMRYGAAPSVSEGWVPLHMEEDYDAPRIERLRGVATYSNHRLFRTSGRLIGPPVR